MEHNNGIWQDDTKIIQLLHLCNIRVYIISLKIEIQMMAYYLLIMTSNKEMCHAGKWQNPLFQFIFSSFPAYIPHPIIHRNKKIVLHYKICPFIQNIIDISSMFPLYMLTSSHYISLALSYSQKAGVIKSHLPFVTWSTHALS